MTKLPGIYTQEYEDRRYVVTKEGLVRGQDVVVDYRASSPLTPAHRILPGTVIVREAYGCWPEPLPVPLIALYGALNFFVANAAEAERGGTWYVVAREASPPSPWATSYAIPAGVIDGVRMRPWHAPDEPEPRP